MGWCSGTSIFDELAKYILSSGLPEDTQFAILLKVARILENEDWDCQQDSLYWQHPLVLRVFQTLHPDWFLED